LGQIAHLWEKTGKEGKKNAANGEREKRIRANRHSCSAWVNLSERQRAAVITTLGGKKNREKTRTV